MVFFLKDQLNAFLENRSSISSRHETATALEFPTITICIEPATKLSEAKKYEFTNINDKFYKEIPNSTFHERFDDMCYLLNKDFYLRSHMNESIKEGLVTIQEVYGDETFLFDVKGIRTYSHGTCYKLEPKFQMTKTPLRFELEIILNQELDQMDKAEYVVLYLTSNKTWVSLMDDIWPQVNPLKQTIDFKREYTSIYANIVKSIFGKMEQNPSSCIKNMVVSSNCSFHCDILTYTDLPLCQSVEQLQCNWDHIYAHFSSYLDCYPTNEATYYTLQQRIENPYHFDRNEISTRVYIGVWSMKIDIKEEVSLLTTEDFIGSIGGSLGMFFGFSISALLFLCIDKAVNQFRNMF